MLKPFVVFLGRIRVFCLSRNVIRGESPSGKTNGGVLLGISGEYGRASATTPSSPSLPFRANMMSLYQYFNNHLINRVTCFSKIFYWHFGTINF